MCVGETRIVNIPPHLGYGETGTDTIPGNSTLKFEYKLVRSYPQFSIDTISKEKPCMEAAGIGSDVGIDYSAHYKIMEPGKTKNWTILDSTFERDQYWGPFKLEPEGNYVTGLYKGMLGMCIGEMREVVVPPQEGYGWKGQDDYVPAHATLFFTIQLIHLKKPTFRVEVLKKAPSLCPARVVLDSTVKLHYSVYVMGGNWHKSTKPELIDSSAGKGAWSFVYNYDTDLVRGLRKGIFRMCIGEKRRIIMPPEMAWSQGLTDYVRPDAHIIFLVEVESVEGGIQEEEVLPAPGLQDTGFDPDL